MAVSFSDVLSGIGASLQGTGQEFMQNLNTREVNSANRDIAMQDRTMALQDRAKAQQGALIKAVQEDASAALRAMDAGDFAGALEIAHDHLKHAQGIPGYDPTRALHIATLLSRGDPHSVAAARAELIAATGSSYQPMKLENRAPGNESVNPFTGVSMGSTPAKQPGPESRIAKQNFDVLHGYMTQAQADAENATSTPQDKSYEETQALRKEFNQLNTVQDFGKQSTAFGRMSASATDPSAAGDLAIIFNYMKVLDPGSTVREGEAASVQQAGSVPDRVIGTYNRILSGEKLSQDQRDDFLKRARKLYDSAETDFNRRVEQYTGIANRRKLNVPDVITDLRYVAPAGNVAAPAGTDPAFWASLNAEQKAQFVKAGGR